MDIINCNFVRHCLFLLLSQGGEKDNKKGQPSVFNEQNTETSNGNHKTYGIHVSYPQLKVGTNEGTSSYN